MTPVEIYSDRYMPGMDRQPKLRPQQPYDFFTNGVSSQLPPPGTIARPFSTAKAGEKRYIRSEYRSASVFKLTADRSAETVRRSR